MLASGVTRFAKRVVLVARVSEHVKVSGLRLTKGTSMYLFSRRSRLAPGNTRDAMAWATGITEKVNQVSGLPVSLFTQVFSPEVCTLVWSTLVPDLATLKAGTDKLNVEDGLVSM